MEQAHAKHLNELASRHRAESELELERLRCGKAQAERALEARERAHKQRVRALEDQVSIEIDSFPKLSSKQKDITLLVIIYLTVI